MNSRIYIGGPERLDADHVTSTLSVRLSLGHEALIGTVCRHLEHTARSEDLD
jgi:hypothetical protein